MNQIEKKFKNIFAYCTRFNESYQVLGKLGRGSSSNVYKIQHKRTKKSFALKAFNHMHLQSN